MIEQGGKRVLNNNYDVVLGSVQTLGRYSGSRLQKFDPKDFGLIIIGIILIK